jgi:hypothetical protein
VIPHSDHSDISGLSTCTYASCYQSLKPVTTEPTSKTDIVDYDIIAHTCMLCMQITPFSDQ